MFAQRPRNLREVIERAGRQHADKVFLVSPEGEEITYADAVSRIARVADTLAREYGVSKGDRVGLASANTVEYILCYWATLSLGAILSNFNGWWTTPELAYGIELTEPVVVLADPRRLELLEKVPAPASGALPPLVPMEVAAAAGLTPDGPDVLRPCRRSRSTRTTRPPSCSPAGRPGVPRAPSTRIATGSTSRCATPPPVPSGWPRPGVSPEVAAKAPQPSAIFAAPIFHISGSGPLTNAPASGMKLVLPPPGRWDETVTLELVQKHRITTLSGVPTQFWRDPAAPRDRQVRPVQRADDRRRRRRLPAGAGPADVVHAAGTSEPVRATA